MRTLLLGHELIHCRLMNAVTLGSVRTLVISAAEDLPSVAMSRRIGQCMNESNLTAVSLKAARRGSRSWEI